jgi:broad specificity phosphatase PhoE
MPVVHLVRHGKTENIGGLVYGRLPEYHLTELGHKQAQQTAERLNDHIAHNEVVELVSSPLERVVETAEHIQAELNLKLQVDDRAIEWASALQAEPFGPGRGRWLSPRGWWLMRNPLRPSWGEPYQEIAERMHGLVIDQVSQVPVSIIVSHELTIGVYRRFIEGRPLWHDPSRRGVDLCSVTTIEFVDTGVGHRPTKVVYWQPPKIEEKKETPA